MELTLDQALRKGIEAQKAGLVQEADQYYTAILKAQPKHPEANHNMGVIAVGVGRVKEAIPFFKAALEANPSIGQFWLSYIDTLIKLDLMDDAKAVFDQAKSKGVKGDAFNQLEKQLGPSPSIKSNAQEPSQEELNSLTKLYNQNRLQQVFNETQTLTKKYPNNLFLWNLMGASAAQIGQLDEAVTAFQKAISFKPDYAEAHNNLGNVLKDQGKLDEAIEAYTKALSIKPGFAETYYNIGNILKQQGKINEAIDSYTKALSIKPDYAEAYYNMGNALQDQGKLDEAIEAYNNALSINPDYAEAYNNMGGTLKEQGKLDEAIEAYDKAISIKPDFAEAYNNMGNALNNQSKLNEAIKAYDKAISIKPDFAEAFNNIGKALKDQGKLDEAIVAYTKALSLKLDFAEPYNNMGNALQDQGKIDEAIKAYNNALSIKPNFADVYWNLMGTSENIHEAKQTMIKCLEIDQKHVKAKLILSALQFYEGKNAEFKKLTKSPLQDHAYMRSFNWVFNLPKLPPLYFHRWALFDHIITLSEKERPFYEFGVWRGEAFKYLIKTFKKGYGFDTFQGLPEDWHDLEAGAYSSNGNVPKIKGGEFIVGKFEDTLPGFFAETRPKASIINFDADLYSSTICALNHARPVIDEHTILIFDEFIINGDWEQDEYKALEEFCAKNHYTYEVLAISFYTKQAAVKIIGI